MFVRSAAVGLCAALLLLASSVVAQDTPPTPAPVPAPAAPAPGPITSSGSNAPLPALLIGPGDQGQITVYGVPDLSQSFQVSSTGDISVPLIGNVHIAGMTSDDAQKVLEKKFSDGGFLVNPHVTVAIKDYTNQGVSVLGEVNRPGTYSIMSSRRLFDAFQSAGGLTQRAGQKITITHRDTKIAASTVEISDDPVKAADSNVELQPGDTVVVPRAGIVYVLGDVVRPGGFVIEQNSTISLMQALAMAAGPTNTAGSKARMLRRTPKGLETHEIDLKKIMQTKAPDVTLQADDIVFVPSSKGKLAASRSSSSILSMLTTLAVYRF